jgi:protease-4
MSLETEALLDRRRLRRLLSFWRVAAIVAAVVALLALAGSSGALRGTLGTSPQIARMTLEGVITDNRDQLRLMKRLANNDSVKAVVLFVNSPGGTTSGGEAMFEAIRNISGKKPVVAQFGTIATSAAYICGLATDQIFARGNTITGSVGVIFQWAEVSELLGKLGVRMNEIKSGPLKANPSPFQPIDQAGRETTEKMVAESMQWFKGLVASRRKIDTASVPGLEQGRIYSGREALGYKLIDQIGGEAEVQKWLVDARGVPKGLRIVDWKPKREESWGVLGMMGRAAASLLGIDPHTVEALLDDPRLAALRLDGLMSVWQPTKSE